MPQLKLIIMFSREKPDEYNPGSINILKFISQNIPSIKQSQANIKIIKINHSTVTPDLIKNLSNRGIKRFPALIVPNRKDPVIGTLNIKRYIKNTLDQYSKIWKDPGNIMDNDQYNINPELFDKPPPSNFNTSSLDSFRQSVLDAGDEDTHGVDSENQDMMRKYTERQQRVPSHYRTDDSHSNRVSGPTTSEFGADTSGESNEIGHEQRNMTTTGQEGGINNAFSRIQTGSGDDRNADQLIERMFESTDDNVDYEKIQQSMLNDQDGFFESLGIS